MASKKLFPGPSNPEYPLAHELSSLEELDHPSHSKAKHAGHASIGEGVHVNGEIRDCREIEIHGYMEGDLEADDLIVHVNGSVKGGVKVERAEIHGAVEGEVTVTQRLDVRTTGLVSGTVTYGELSVEAGGRVTGTLDQQPDAAGKTLTPTPPEKKTDTPETEPLDVA